MNQNKPNFLTKGNDKFSFSKVGGVFFALTAILFLIEYITSGFIQFITVYDIIWLVILFGLAVILFTLQSRKIIAIGLGVFALYQFVLILLSGSILTPSLCYFVGTLMAFLCAVLPIKKEMVYNAAMKKTIPYYNLTPLWLLSVLPLMGGFIWAFAPAVISLKAERIMRGLWVNLHLLTLLFAVFFAARRAIEDDSPLEKPDNEA